VRANILAAGADLDRSYVAEIEAGSRNPSTKALASCGRALGVTLSELLQNVGGLRLHTMATLTVTHTRPTTYINRFAVLR
jgi:transcriptional regulator with XRE-family HTH domain